MGIRLNKRKPNIYFKAKKTGGVAVTSMIPLTKIDEKLVHSILAEYSTAHIFLFPNYRLSNLSNSIRLEIHRILFIYRNF